MATCSLDIIQSDASPSNYDTIQPEISSATERATEAFSQAIEFLNEISSAVDRGISRVSVGFDDIDTTVPSYTTPVTPEIPDIEISIPNLPADFQPGNISGIDLNAIGTLPSFSDTAPTISLPTTPAPFTGTLDTDAPTVQTEFNFPDAPTYTLPPVPTFEELNIPTAPDLNIPTFSETLPVISDVSVPSISFYWGDESPFSDELLAAVEVKLLDWVQNGGTGLSPTVEQAIYDRARNREDTNSVRSEQQVLVEQAARGFSRPSGSTLAALDALAQETQNKTADLSREIMIKQAELEQSNMQFAIQQTIALEQLLINEHQQIQQRSFEAAKYAQDIAVQIFNAEVSKMGLALEAYKSYATAYEAQVRAALSEIEIFKSEIQAQGLISEINKDQVVLYTSQLEAIRTSVDIYKTEVDAVSSQLQAESLKIENFKGLIQAYSAQVDAKKTEYIGYSEAVKGELAKTEIYDSQVKAFIGRIDAYGKSVDAQSKIVDTDVEVEKLRLNTYLGKLEAIIKQIQAETAAYSTQVDVYRGQAQMYSAEITSNTAKSELALKGIDSKIQLAKLKADVAIKNAEINIQNMFNNNQLALQAATSGADVAKGLAQASLAALSIGASITSNESTNTNYSNQRSKNVSCTELKT